jgi:hypothetical protein
MHVACMQKGQVGSSIIMHGSGGEVEVDSFIWQVLSALPVEVQTQSPAEGSA